MRINAYSYENGVIMVIQFKTLRSHYFLASSAYEFLEKSKSAKKNIAYLK